MSRPFSSLRARLTILVLMAMVPAMLLVVYLGLRQRQLNEWEAQDNAAHWAHQVTAQQRQAIAVARQLLVAMARVPLLRSADTNACAAFLAEECERYPAYANLALVDLQGRIRCSARPLESTGAAVSNETWFLKLRRTNEFTVGDYASSRVHQGSILNVAAPLFERQGRLAGLLHAELNLEAVRQVANDVELPLGGSIFLCTTGGAVLARYPEAGGTREGPPVDSSLLAQMARLGSGSLKQAAFGFRGNLYGFVPAQVMAGQQPCWVVVELPVAVAYAQANRALLMNIGPLVLVGLLVFAAIRLGGHRLLVQPVSSLVATTERLAAGDLSARTGEPYEAGEVGQLRRSFDRMAAALAQREHQLKSSNRALQAVRQCSQMVVRATNEQELLDQICHIVVAHGGYRVAWVGYAEEGPAGRRIRPVAAAGGQLADLQDIEVRWDESEHAQGPTGSAVRSGKPVVVQDVATDPSFAPWRDKAAELGFRAALALPLSSGGVTLGSLTIYTTAQEAFSPEAVALLQGMADDLAYGIMGLRNRAERQRAEERLQESERRFRSVVESSPMGMHFWELQPDGRLLLTGANPAADVILGVQNQQFLGQELLTAFPGLAGTEVPARYAEVCRRSLPWRTEHLEYADGKITGAFEVHAFQTGPQRMVALFFSIAERRRAQEALRQSEQRLRELFEASPDAVLVVDQGGRLLDVNPAACQLHGMSHAQLVGKPLVALVPPAQRAIIERELPRLVNGQIDKTEGLSQRANGEAVPVEIKAGHTQYAGRPALLLHVRDITERVRAEERHRRLATAVEQAVEGFMITDAAGNIQYVNPALELMTGYQREELIGRSPRIFRSGKHDAEFYRDLWQTLGRGDVWRGFFFNRKKDGSVYQEEAMVSPIRDSAGQVTSYVAVKRDVTREIAMELQLLQAQKMEAIGRLAGGLAHDFNNILTAITGYSELGLRKLAAADPLRHNIEEIMKAADRATTLTRQLLAFSRKQVLEPRQLDLNVLVNNIQRMLRPLIGEDIDLLTALAPDLWPIKADAGQIEQVLMNLAVNARDAMPLGGRILIATANITIDPLAAQRHYNLRPGDYVELTVSDTGVGMTEEVKAHLFEPFFTTKPNDKGTGLGLATCYGIVEQSGGHIEVSSKLGSGSSFHIYLPRLIDRTATIACPEILEVALPRSRGNETVLLVEDEEAVRELGQIILADLGYRVLAAGNGVEALALLSRQPSPALDLLVTDVVMPQMGGRELAQRMRQLQPDLRVLFCSGYTAESEWVSNALTKYTLFLQKPFSAAQLAQKVRDVLDG